MFPDIESVSDEDLLDDYEEDETGKGNDSDFSEDTPFQVLSVLQGMIQCYQMLDENYL